MFLHPIRTARALAQICSRGLQMIERERAPKSLGCESACASASVDGSIVPSSPSPVSLLSFYSPWRRKGSDTGEGRRKEKNKVNGSGGARPSFVVHPP